MYPAFIFRLFIATIIICSSAAAQRIPVKVVVVTMFERGADTGDQPGEFQFWVEREKLSQVLPFPQGWRNLRMNSEGVLGVCTGVGTAKAASSIMALGMDPRFDLTKAYWLIAGISGVDPDDASIGSAAWAEWIIDGDLGHELDAREIPADWKTGMIPLRKAKPYELPRVPDEGEVYHLLPSLVDWAYRLTRDVKLEDNEPMRNQRARYLSRRNANRPPFVLKGDTLSSSTFWHGRRLSEWANDWVKYYTDNAANYVTCAMEDTGTMQSLTFLHAAGKVDRDRVLVLRTASNFDQQRDSITAAESLAETKIGGYVAYLPSLEAAWRVGSVVVHELLRNWKLYEGQLPR